MKCVLAVFPTLLSGVLMAQVSMPLSPKAEEFLLDSNLRKIKVSSESGSVEIVSGSGKANKVIFTKKNPSFFEKNCRFEITKIRNKVHVRNEKLPKKSGHSCEVDMQIYVEKDDGIEISNGAGDLKYSGDIQDLEVKLGAGNLTGVGNISKGDLNLGAGNLKLDSALIGTLKVEAGAGNVELAFHQLIEKSKLKVHAHAGNVHISAKALPKDAEFDIKSGAGNIDIRIPKDSSVKTKLDSGMGFVMSDFSSTAHTKLSVEAHTKKGNVSLKKN